MKSWTMNHFGAPCLNNYNNIANRQKAFTLQNNKRYIFEKYFKDFQQSLATNYANVPLDHESPPSLKATANHHANNHHHRQVSRHSHHSRSQHVHSRSHSQHYYQTMHHQFHPSVNDPNNYYNLTNLVGPPPPMTVSRHSPINEPLLNNRTHLDCITVMQVCNELGNNIDSAPPMPSSRQYSIVITNNGYFKMAFPQSRTMMKNFQDPNTKLFIKAGEIVSVLGPSKEDRSKFTICYKEQHIDVQHQYCLALPIQTRFQH
jgi:hypothetical protein